MKPGLHYAARRRAESVVYFPGFCGPRGQFQSSSRSIDHGCSIRSYRRRRAGRFVSCAWFGATRRALEAVKASGMTEVLPGHQALAFEQDKDGVSVEVTVPAGGARTYRGPYLIGCDGAHSAIRRSLGWGLVGKTYSPRILLADLRIQGERDQLPWPRLAPAQGQILAAARYEPEHWRIISTLQKSESGMAALQRSADQ
jgi:2-polyprenyl-6-methoxyphenol hydroxylase-like FAD-dependent oxidoreductase